MSEPLRVVVEGVVIGEFVGYSVAHVEGAHEDDGRTTLHLDVDCNHQQLALFMEMLARRYDVGRIEMLARRYDVGRIEVPR